MSVPLYKQLNGKIDLKQLRHAVAAADYGSFRQAAEALNIKQSTLSRSILQLEHATSIRLFESGRASAPPPSRSLPVTGSPPLGVRRSARRTCSACNPLEGRRTNDNNEHRGENVMNAPDTILYRGLFTTPLVAALRRTDSYTTVTAKSQQTYSISSAKSRI
jgi:Bacterial regulatory helix-turn-helix protein, lysR family